MPHVDLDAPEQGARAVLKQKTVEQGDHALGLHHKFQGMTK